MTEGPYYTEGAESGRPGLIPLASPLTCLGVSAVSLSSVPFSPGTLDIVLSTSLLGD